MLYVGSKEGMHWILSAPCIFWHCFNSTYFVKNCWGHTKKKTNHHGSFSQGSVRPTLVTETGKNIKQIWYLGATTWGYCKISLANVPQRTWELIWHTKKSPLSIRNTYSNGFPDSHVRFPGSWRHFFFGTQLAGIKHPRHWNRRDGPILKTSKTKVWTGGWSRNFATTRWLVQKSGGFTLPEINIPLKIGLKAPKGNQCLPTIHFQVRAVSFREGKVNRP